jgi:hypothetical protein
MAVALLISMQNRVWFEAPMDGAQDLRNKAVRCMQQADATDDRRTKAVLKDLARDYARRADEAERPQPTPDRKLRAK